MPFDCSSSCSLLFYYFYHLNSPSQQVDIALPFFSSDSDTVLHAPDEELSNEVNNGIIENVTNAPKAAFPGISINATFGNHDYLPSNQFPAHNNQLYNDTLLKWMSWISDSSQDEPFLKGNIWAVCVCICVCLCCFLNNHKHN